MDLRQHITESELMTSAKKQIERAKKGDFSDWVKSKPKILQKIYRVAKQPTADEIIKAAEAGKLKDLNAIDHWETDKSWKKWKADRWEK